MRVPVVGVGGVVVQDGRALLIRRGKEPLKGRWVIPGGTVEWGEPLSSALVREMEEETGLIVRPRELLIAFDRLRHRDGEVEYHYVILDYLCTWVSGSPRPGSDAAGLVWARPEELAGLETPGKVTEVIGLAFSRLRLHWPLARG